MDAVALALPVLIALITVALAFDFLNGLHDAANSIATIVSTRVLRPQHAVIWAAFFNFVAFLIFGAHVAETVGTGIIAAEIVDPRVVFGALAGAMAWNVITWALGIPSSSSHALIGGLVGAGVAKAGSRPSSGAALPRPPPQSCSRRSPVHSCAADLPDHLMGVRALHALCRRSRVPFAATRLRFALLHRSRW
jgi:hypothetical protein